MNNSSRDEIISIKNPSNIKEIKIKKYSFIFGLIGYILIVIFLLNILVNIRSLKAYLTNFHNFYQSKNILKASKTIEHHDSKSENPLKNLQKNEINFYQMLFEFESKNLYLKEINKKRTFEKRYPLPKEINCYQHLRFYSLMDLIAFTSFLTKDTIFFEFGSGCSSVIAKYYAKKSLAVEGDKNWYEIGIKNNLKENILFKDIKPTNKKGYWSNPGKESNLEDWKNYFQAYKAEYNADVIFIDGRFRVACAFDIFNKIKNDTIILIHEYFRPSYLIIEKYYDYIYHWGTLYLFKKKANIKEIPLDFQKQYWNDFA